MRAYPVGNPAAPTLVFGHGAGAGQDHPWIVRVAKGLAGRGVRVVTFDFPYKAEGRKLPDKGPVLEEAFRRVWDDLMAQDRAAGTAGLRYFAGGKSMGARIASQAAARQLLAPPPVGLVFFGYPLHPPGKPDQRRDRHLPDVPAPMLFLHGTRDPFGSSEEIRELAADLAPVPGAALEIIDGGDHSLVAPKGKGLAGQSLERAMDAAAAWITRVR